MEILPYIKIDRLYTKIDSRQKVVSHFKKMVACGKLIIASECLIKWTVRIVSHSEKSGNFDRDIKFFASGIKFLMWY